jgi:hypothetical protein
LAKVAKKEFKERSQEPESRSQEGLCVEQGSLNDPGFWLLTPPLELLELVEKIRYGAGCPVRHESDGFLTPRRGGLVRQSIT